MEITIKREWKEWNESLISRRSVGIQARDCVYGRAIEIIATSQMKNVRQFDFFNSWGSSWWNYEKQIHEQHACMMHQNEWLKIFHALFSWTYVQQTNNSDQKAKANFPPFCFHRMIKFHFLFTSDISFSV